MDIWQKMYEKAQALYQPQEVSDFVYARHVVAAVEAEDGQIFTGFCMEGTCGVFHLCAERAALFNMYQDTGQTKVKRSIAFRDRTIWHALWSLSRIFNGTASRQSSFRVHG